MVKLYNHITAPLSELDMQMVIHIPPGGNWKHIPPEVPSKRLEQIRRTGGRTTYYGRLRWDAPAYTISTYFNRVGNGCFVHPEQNRLISIREGARLQSFPDSFIFRGSKTAQYKQVGNAVPPLLARVIAEGLVPHVSNKTIVDLFSGAGGLSEGFRLEGYTIVGAIEHEKQYFETYLSNAGVPQSFFICGDIQNPANKEKLVELKKQDVGIVLGGPPCQGFSLAGWRRDDDERNNLFVHFVELVDKIRPEFFIMENVPGLLTMRNGQTIRDITMAFKKIGFFVNPPILLKAEAYGVPQKRRRVFIIGSRDKTKIMPPGPLFAENSLTLPTPVTVRDAISGLPPLEPGGGSFEMDYLPKNLTPYQEFLAGKIDFREFHAKQIKKRKRQLVFT